MFHCDDLVNMVTNAPHEGLVQRFFHDDIPHEYQ